MITIEKYPLNSQMNDIDLPKGAEVFSAVAGPPGVVLLWARVDSSNPVERRRFFVLVGVRQCVDAEALADYIGTACHGPQHRLVYSHVFEGIYSPLDAEDEGAEA